LSTRSSLDWFGAIFGMVFVFAGLAATYDTVGKMTVGYIATIGWNEVHVRVHEIEFVVKHEPATMYKLTCTYSYYVDGKRYFNDRVSLSPGSDNYGTYWHDLDRSVRTRQRNDVLTAFVNPSDPTQAVLDRTLRWQQFGFVSFFFFGFCGAGGLIAWYSLKKSDGEKAHTRQIQSDGIENNEKNAHWFGGLFGAGFLGLGSWTSYLTLPDALRNGDYAALFGLVFVLVGLVFIVIAIKQWLDYRRLGAIPLFLHPIEPGVGGQLGGNFSINIESADHQFNSSNSLLATLACKLIDTTGEDTTFDIKWQAEAPVHLKQTAHGIEASFLFDIPSNCKPTQRMSRGIDIVWSVEVSGNIGISGLVKFKRSWIVHVARNATQATGALSTLHSYLQNAKT